MTALAIHLPDNLAKASMEAAKQLGLSRTEFIRQAIVHELEFLTSSHELEEITAAFAKMKDDKTYLQELNKLKMLDASLPEDEEDWWKK